MNSACSMLRRRLASVLCVAFLLAGCGHEPVREDRTVHFSGDGAQVGFQHGEQGIYVTGRNGGPPIRVFQPGEDVHAVSTPLWSPVDDLLIFTTAENPREEQDASETPAAPRPDEVDTPRIR